MNLLTFGSDPEFFVSKKVDGKDFVVPPAYFHKYLNVKHVVKSRKHPEFIHTKDGVIIHQDGVAFEFKVPTVKTAKDLKFYIDQGLDALSDFAGKFGFDLYAKPTINFDTKEFIGETEIFKDSLIFGCDRDWDAFDYENYNSSTIDASEHSFRYGGGHLHISGEKLLSDYPLPSIQLMAITVGNYFVLNSIYPDLDKQRTFLYGKPGKFRPQKYPNGETGIEYRTPSNSWLNSLEEMEGVLEHAYKAVELLKNPSKAKEILNALTGDTIRAIMDFDQNLAKENLTSF